MSKRSGFTLIELLVVISIIALLLAILMPSLSRAKELAKRAWCLSSVRSLSLAWIMYADENDGMLCAPNSWWDHGWIKNVPAPHQYTPIEAPEDIQTEALKAGVLYPFVETTDIFRCPVAKKSEMRTFSCNYVMGSTNKTVSYTVQKISQIRRTAQRIVFLDDYGQNWDAQWVVHYDQPKWWNPIPARHGNGTTLSFADGHSDWIHWKDPRTIEWSELSWIEAENRKSTSQAHQPDNEDLERIQKGIFGTLGY